MNLIGGPNEPGNKMTADKPIKGITPGAKVGKKSMTPSLKVKGSRKV